MGIAKKTGGAFEGARYYVDDERLSGQRIVLRAWPSSWNREKWIVEAFAEYDCQVELAVLPISSPCGSAEADELTKLCLSERGARIFSTGRRVMNTVLESQTLHEALRHESYLESHRRLSQTLRGLRETAERETAARIADWRRRLEELKS